MKRSIIVATVLFVSVISKAQTFTIGLTGGGGQSWLQDYISGQTSNVAWNGGLSFTYRNQSRFGLGADLLYAAEGAKFYNLTEPSGFIKKTLNTNYLRIPLKLIYFFGNEKSFIQPYINAGPNIGILMPSQSILISNDVKTQFDTKEDVSKVDAGVNAGAGLNFRLSPKLYFKTEVVYYRGLNDVMKSDDSKQYNENVQFNIGFSFAFKK